MRDHRSLPVAIALIVLFSGCAGRGSIRPADTLRPLKKAAEEETESVGRFSRKAVSDAEMLQGHSAQEYRDSVVP